jgi:hypothetical protein
MRVDEFTKEIHSLMQEENQERVKALERYELAGAELRELDARIAALERTLELYSQRHGLVAEKAPIVESLRAKFGNMKTKDALIEIARDNGGLLLAAEAGKILVRAGFFKNNASAAGTIYPTLHRYAVLFEKVGKGKYRLVQTPPERAQSHSHTVSIAPLFEGQHRLRALPDALK